MSAKPKQNEEEKQGHHPRSRHRTRYDFERLTTAHPALGALVSKNVHGEPTIDFADPAAVQQIIRQQAEYVDITVVGEFEDPEWVVAS
jgi:23S rRNA (adenine1618-N6)-methyltransferase